VTNVTACQLNRLFRGLYVSFLLFVGLGGYDFADSVELAARDIEGIVAREWSDSH